MNNKAKVTLVGAGPGDVELITLKGLRAIKNADIILYDALVNKELLEYANTTHQYYMLEKDLIITLIAKMILTIY